jgi:hypothetical protein
MNLYKLTANLNKATVQSVVTGAIWKNCAGSSTLNEFNLFVFLATKSGTPQTIGSNPSSIFTLPSVA